MHERTLVPFFGFSCGSFEALSVLSIFLHIVTPVSCFSAHTECTNFWNPGVAVATATVSARLLSLLNLETPPVIYQTLQVVF